MSLFIATWLITLSSLQPLIQFAGTTYSELIGNFSMPPRAKMLRTLGFELTTLKQEANYLTRRV
jgi:hypothetical protein